MKLRAGTKSRRAPAALRPRKKEADAHGAVVCPGALELLDGRPLSRSVRRELAVLTPARQVEVVRAMIALDCFTVTFAAVLATASPADRFVDLRQRRVEALTDGQRLRLERESARLERQLVLVQATHRALSLELVLIQSYLDRMMSNGRVVRHLARYHPDALRMFQDAVDPKVGAGHSRSCASATTRGESRADRGTGMRPAVSQGRRRTA